MRMIPFSYQAALPVMPQFIPSSKQSKSIPMAISQHNGLLFYQWQLGEIALAAPTGNLMRSL